MGHDYPAFPLRVISESESLLPRLCFKALFHHLAGLDSGRIWDTANFPKTLVPERTDL